MKAVFTLTGFAIGCGLGISSVAIAQKAPQEHSMTGCLATGDDPGTFKLTNLEKGPAKVVIAESATDLTPHVGHKVEITGMVMPGKDSTHTMKVTALKHIAAACP